MLDAHEIGLMCQPASNRPQPGWIWAADNGCFSATWDADKWLRWLTRPHPRSGCLFAVVPDVVADHAATLERWHQWAPTVAALRYPVAFVAQNGCTPDDIPEGADTVFIGGDTDWKLSEDAHAVAAAARATGRWVHLGRANSLRRLATWRDLADSADGTFLTYAPAAQAPIVKGWTRRLRSEPSLFARQHTEARP